MRYQVLLTGLMFVLAASGNSSAKPTAERRSLEAHAMRGEFTQRDHSRVRLRSHRTAQEWAGRVLDWTRPKLKRTLSDDSTRSVRWADESISLEVTGGDGDVSVRFARARRVERRNGGKSADWYKEAAYRTFDSQLRGVLELGAHESVVAHEVKLQVVGGRKLSEKQDAPEYVESSRVEFLRCIDGIPILGGGSRLSIELDTDGQVLEIDFRWPQYTVTTTKAKSVSFSTLAKTVQATGQAVSEYAGPMPATAAPTVGQMLDVNVAPNTVLSSMVCGYYDSGESDPVELPFRCEASYETGKANERDMEHSATVVAIEATE